VKVYTRRGDRGETDLFGGMRVAKDDLRVEAYGAVDELNAFVGQARAASRHGDVRSLLRGVQSTLFDLGAYLATPDPGRREKSAIPVPDDEDVRDLERSIDAFEGELEPLRSFVLPGGTPASSALHVARTVCRRAERRAVALDREQKLEPVALRYLNRLSDLLFVMARLENRRAGEADVAWPGRGNA
jgi:cob(I)alamin adenosyltransferase